MPPDKGLSPKSTTQQLVFYIYIYGYTRMFMDILSVVVSVSESISPTTLHIIWHFFLWRSPALLLYAGLSESFYNSSSSSKTAAHFSVHVDIFVGLVP